MINPLSFVALAAAPAPSPAPLSPAALAAARQYLYGALAWSVAEEILLLALLAAVFYGGFSAACARALRRRNWPAWLVDAGVIAAVFATVLVALFPLDAVAGYLREGWYGFQHLSFAAWLGEWAASTLLTIAAGLLVAVPAYAWLRRAGKTSRAGLPWWMRLWIVIAAAVVFAVAIDPVVIEPLFNRFTPVANATLSADIHALAVRAGIPNARILEMNASRQSGHTNAYVNGILGSQRIVLYDTLLRRQNPAEIEFVVGHEIGHYVLNHLWKGVAFTVALLFALFALAGWLYPKWSRGTPANDIAGVPLVLLILLAALYLLAPLTNGFSRWEEHQADAYGLHLVAQVEPGTTGACAAVASFQREEHTDLIYPNPPRWIVWWFFTHPSQQQRIDFAQQFCRKQARRVQQAAHHSRS